MLSFRKVFLKSVLIFNILFLITNIPYSWSASIESLRTPIGQKSTFGRIEEERRLKKKRYISLEQLFIGSPIKRINHLLGDQELWVKIDTDIDIPAVIVFAFSETFLTRLPQLFRENEWFRSCMFQKETLRVAIEELKRMDEELRQKGKTNPGLLLADYFGKIEAEIIAKNLPNPPSGKILEVGCSTGTLIRELKLWNERVSSKELSEGNEYYAIDIDKLAIDFGKKEREREKIIGIDFIYGNVTATAFSDSYFDFIVDKQLIEIARVQRERNPSMVFEFFMEASRILKENGIYFSIYWPSEWEGIASIAKAFNFELIDRKHIDGLMTVQGYTIGIFKKRGHAQFQYDRNSKAGFAVGFTVRNFRKAEEHWLVLDSNGVMITTSVPFSPWKRALKQRLKEAISLFLFSDKTRTSL